MRGLEGIWMEGKMGRKLVLGLSLRNRWLASMDGKNVSTDLMEDL